jgi:predicted regulator of Ras-like GTPase activity (Roadblock/LC7/MglB family)
LSQNASRSQTEIAVANVVAITSVGGEDSVFAGLGASLAEIHKLTGVVGYILRGSTSAMVDLPEPEKISQFAVLSYQLCESGVEIAKQLNVAEVESVLVEGGDLKVLCMRIGENNISVFMEKSASHTWITKRILI